MELLSYNIHTSVLLSLPSRAVGSGLNSKKPFRTAPSFHAASSILPSILIDPCSLLMVMLLLVLSWAEHSIVIKKMSDNMSIHLMVVEDVYCGSITQNCCQILIL